MSLPRTFALALTGLLALGGHGLLSGCGASQPPMLAPSGPLVVVLDTGMTPPFYGAGTVQTQDEAVLSESDVPMEWAQGTVDDSQEPMGPGGEDSYNYIDDRGIPRSEPGVASATAPTNDASLPVSEEAQVDDADPSALTDFRQDLDPYGRWVTHPKYGTLWVPHESAVGTRFAPYVTRGRWALTDDDQWVWESSYPFGWVVFHYGRWVWADSLGWSWVPGRQYSHAWVSFRTTPVGGAYIGWAPLAPSYFWFRGSPVFFGTAFPMSYVYCPSRFVFASSVNSYLIYQRHRIRQIASRTHVVSRHGSRGASPRLGALGSARSNVPRARVAPDRRALAARRFVGAANSPRAPLSGSAAPRGARAAGSQTPFGAPRAAGNGAGRSDRNAVSSGRRLPAGARPSAPRLAPASAAARPSNRAGITNWSKGTRATPAGVSPAARPTTPPTSQARGLRRRPASPSTAPRASGGRRAPRPAAGARPSAVFGGGSSQRAVVTSTRRSQSRAPAGTRAAPSRASRPPSVTPRGPRGPAPTNRGGASSRASSSRAPTSHAAPGSRGSSSSSAKTRAPRPSRAKTARAPSAGSSRVPAQRAPSAGSSRAPAQRAPSARAPRAPAPRARPSRAPSRGGASGRGAARASGRSRRR